MKTILNGGLIAIGMITMPIIVIFYGYPGEKLSTIIAIICTILAITTISKLWRIK